MFVEAVPLAEDKQKGRRRPALSSRKKPWTSRRFFGLKEATAPFSFDLLVLGL
jgi:hypothetical protein